MITITGKVVFDAKEDKTENQRYRMYFMVLCNSNGGKRYATILI